MNLDQVAATALIVTMAGTLAVYGIYRFIRWSVPAWKRAANILKQVNKESKQKEQEQDYYITALPKRKPTRIFTHFKGGN